MNPASDLQSAIDKQIAQHLTRAQRSPLDITRAQRSSLDITRARRSPLDTPQLRAGLSLTRPSCRSQLESKLKRTSLSSCNWPVASPAAHARVRSNLLSARRTLRLPKPAAQTGQRVP